MGHPNLSLGRLDSEAALAAAAEIVGLAFASTAEQAKEWITKNGTEDMRVLRDGSSVVGTLRLVPMGQYWGGRSVPMAGIAGVGVSPHARGKGVALRLMQESLRELRESGWPISGLYPATQTLYRRAGYEQAGTRFHIAMPLSRIDVRSRTHETMRLTNDDAPAVQACYAKFAARLGGYLDRGPYCWNRVRENRDGPAAGFGFRAGGELRGYAYYTQTRKPNGKHDLALTDIAAASADAARDILSFLAEHRSMADEAVWHAGPHDPFLALVPEQPYSLTLHHYWMLRILDVKSALEARGYPLGVRAEVHFEIDDDLFQENRARWALTVEGGRGTVRQGGDGSIRLDIRSLVPLFSGLRSPWELLGLGALSGDEISLGNAAACFAGPAPATPDMY